MIYIITGPSGVGKNTIIKELSKYLDFYFSVSHTTRPRRENEIDGKDYYFISEVEFEDLINNDQMIEYEQYGDFYYGTSKDELSNESSIIFPLVNSCLTVTAPVEISPPGVTGNAGFKESCPSDRTKLQRKLGAFSVIHWRMLTGWSIAPSKYIEFCLRNFDVFAKSVVLIRSSVEPSIVPAPAVVSVNK